MSIALILKKNKNNYGFLGIRNGQLYTDYSSRDCTKFNSMEDAKPYINRLVKAGFTVTPWGFCKDSGKKDFSKDITEREKTMEERKFCLKSKAELDEIRENKINKKDSDNLKIATNTKISENTRTEFYHLDKEGHLNTHKETEIAMNNETPDWKVVKAKTGNGYSLEYQKGTLKNLRDGKTKGWFRSKEDAEKAADKLNNIKDDSYNKTMTANEALEASKKYLDEISDKTVAKVTRRRELDAEKTFNDADRRNPKTILNARDKADKLNKHKELKSKTDYSYRAYAKFEADSEEFKQLSDFAKKLKDESGLDFKVDTIEKNGNTITTITAKNNKANYNISPKDQETILLGKPDEADKMIKRISTAARIKLQESLTLAKVGK